MDAAGALNPSEGLGFGDDAPDGLGKTFNEVAKGALWIAGTLATELVLFAFMHGTPEGAIIGALAGEWLQPIFDFFGLTGWAPTGMEGTAGIEAAKTATETTAATSAQAANTAMQSTAGASPLNTAPAANMSWGMQ